MYTMDVVGKFKVNNEEYLEKIKEKFAALNDLYFQSSSKVAYYYFDIETESMMAFNSSILFYAASCIKMIVCLLIFEKAERNELSLDEKILITKDDLKQDTGVIKKQKQDTYYTLLELIYYTLVESDNSAFLKLIQYVGEDAYFQFASSLGCQHLKDGKDLFGLVNANDLLRCWQNVKKFIDTSVYGKILHKYLSNPSFSIVDFKNLKGHNFVKKYGSYEIAYHEAGYVEDEHPFYLILLSQKNQCNDKKAFLNQSAQLIYEIHELLHKAN